MKNISRCNESLMFASAQLKIPIVCLRAWQFRQSVKPKVNISPLSPSAQCLSLILARAPSEPSGGPNNHPRTIPWPAPSLLLGQHWTQFRKVRPFGHFSEADARLTKMWSYDGDCYKWRRNKMIFWRNIGSITTDLKTIISNEVIWIQWGKTNGWKNVCENNISSINCLDFPRWANMRFLLNRYFCRYWLLNGALLA